MTLSNPFFLALILFTTSLLSLLPLTQTQTISFNRFEQVNAVVVPITKESSTSLYTITLDTAGVTRLSSNPTPTEFINTTNTFLIDLTSGVVWSPCNGVGFVHCTASICTVAGTYFHNQCPHTIFDSGPSFGPVSPSYRPSPCRCIIGSFNPLTNACFIGEEFTTFISINSTNGKNPTLIIDADIVNICANESALIGLPPGVTGAAGFGHSDYASLPARLAWDLGFKNTFALCLPSTTNSPGVAFFGAKPYYLLPQNQDITKSLSYTKFLKSPNTTDAAYYLDVTGLAINQKTMQSLKGKLYLDSAGRGGVKLSTIIPYTSMRSDIYKRFVKTFRAATKNLGRMRKVKPFDLCYDTRNLSSTRVGYAVPSIDLNLKGRKKWTIYGANSMKDVKENTACLAFVDGGMDMVPAITLGGFQMEDSFLLFDIPNSTLGFISTLRGMQTTCSNFNFTNGVY